MGARVDHFSDRAPRYARHRPAYPEALADFLASVAPRRGLVWDAGCGSGQLSIPMADRFEGVVATDASVEQIRQAPSHPRVVYRVATSEASGLIDRCVDLAIAAQAAHWFDLGAYYAEVSRVGRPGAAVALVTYGTMSIAPDVDAVIGSFYRDVLGPYWAPERRHVEEGYGSMLFPFRRIAAPVLQMRARWTLDGLLGYLGTWSSVRAAEREGGTPLVELRPRLARAWGPERERRLVRWPLAIRAGYL